MAYDIAFRARRAVIDGVETAATVTVRDGVIASVEGYGASVEAGQLVDVPDDAVLLPGMVDSHVHINEPGRTEWEGFESATRAAAAGGVTTLVDMPLNSIPATVDVASLQIKRTAADGQLSVDVGFWGGAVPGNLGQLRPLHDAGVFGVKCFTVDSGVAEFPPLPAAEIRDALAELARFDGLLIVHAEDPGVLAASPPSSGADYPEFLASRPAEAENSAIATVIALAEQTGARVHIVHVSSAEALAQIAAAKRAGLPITAETCPHYLFFAAEDIRTGATQFKCCPPIRPAANRELLWQGLANRVIDIVVSDHSPCTPELKDLDTGDFGTAWGGIASIQLSLSAVWTQARARGFTLVDVTRWMASGPARLVGLDRAGAPKGIIAVGAAADLIVFAPDESFVVDGRALAHRSPVTPYDGAELAGVVRQTYLRGELITDDARRGHLLARPGSRAAA